MGLVPHELRYCDGGKRRLGPCSVRPVADDTSPRAVTRLGPGHRAPARAAESPPDAAGAALADRGVLGCRHWSRGQGLNDQPGHASHPGRPLRTTDPVERERIRALMAEEEAKSPPSPPNAAPERPPR